MCGSLKVMKIWEMRNDNKVNILFRKRILPVIGKNNFACKTKVMKTARGKMLTRNSLNESTAHKKVNKLLFHLNVKVFLCFCKAQQYIFKRFPNKYLVIYRWWNSAIVKIFFKLSLMVFLTSIWMFFKLRNWEKLKDGTEKCLQCGESRISSKEKTDKRKKAL